MQGCGIYKNLVHLVNGERVLQLIAVFLHLFLLVTVTKTPGQQKEC